MTTDRVSATEAPAATASPAVRRGLGLALLVIACAQLLISLDNTIVNIALPSMETGLDISRANLAWVVTAYALPFGGLLLVGGRAGDLFGRRPRTGTAWTAQVRSTSPWTISPLPASRSKSPTVSPPPA
ncbi:MAG TPA: MFS transporter [Natronosporangium sp.]|nr:MFS transporter [Natronosporangium sp.]